MPPRTPRPGPAPIAESPAVERVRAGGPAALAEFWARIERDGSPLVESDGDGTLLTFVWRERVPTREVHVLANKLADRSDPGSSRMRRMPGTDLWHLTYRVRPDWQGSYHLAPGGDLVADPYNSRILRQERPPHKSVAAGPLAGTGSRWWRPRAGVPAGRTDLIETPDGRRVWRYRPPGHRPEAGPYPLLVMLDGDLWGPLMPVGVVLDNLVAAGRIPPVVALLPESGGRERRFTEYACSPGFAEFLGTGLPALAAAELNPTADPARTVIAGQSLGGLAAAHAALSFPERFGNVLTQSGAFWWRSNTPGDVGAQWLAGLVARTPCRPVRWHVEVGLDEWVNLRPNRRLRDVLTARGYRLSYAEFAGGHDRLCWRDRLGAALAVLFG